MTVLGWYKSLKEKKESERWKKLISKIQDDIAGDKLTIMGYHSVIMDVVVFRNKYGLNYEKYVELADLPRAITKLIYNKLYDNSFNIDDLNSLTSYIIISDYQKALFDFNCYFKKIVSPEYFFEKTFWDAIVTDKLFLSKMYTEQFMIWIKNSFFVLPEKEDIDECKNVNCCAYFLTFFALAFMLKLEPNLGYAKYKEAIQQYNDKPEIVFVFHLVMFYIMRNLNSVNCTYFEQHNSLMAYQEVLEQFEEDRKSWFKVDVSSFSKSFEKSFKETLIKIVYDNCKNSQNEIYNAECALASEILGEEFGADEEWQTAISEIDKLCSEVFTR